MVRTDRCADRLFGLLKILNRASAGECNGTIQTQTESSAIVRSSESACYARRRGLIAGPHPARMFARNDPCLKRPLNYHVVSIRTAWEGDDRQEWGLVS